MPSDAVFSREPLESPSKELVDEVQAACNTRYEAGLRLLEDLVNTDSFPEEVSGLEAVVDLAAAQWSELGFSNQVKRTDEGLPVLLSERRVAKDATTILVLIHLDTVFPPGTSAKRPFTMDEVNAYGPGVADMKGGAVTALMAVGAALDVSETLDHVNLVILQNTDEEAGSVQSRPLIEAQCAGTDLALVFEPGRPDGSMVTTRRGVRRYRISVRGRPAHTGVEPWNGLNAIEEIGHKILAIQELNDRERFLSVTTALVEGGSRINIVPEHASIDVDVRIPDLEVAEGTHRRIEEIVGQRVIEGTETRYEIFADRPPMVPQEQVPRLAKWLQQAASHVDVELPIVATGGGSDGCFTSAKGVPTLDGLGPVGGGYHTPDEFLRLETIVDRATIVGAFLASLNR